MDQPPAPNRAGRICAVVGLFLQLGLAILFFSALLSMLRYIPPDWFALDGIFFLSIFGIVASLIGAIPLFLALISLQYRPRWFLNTMAVVGLLWFFLIPLGTLLAVVVYFILWSEARQTCEVEGVAGAGARVPETYRGTWRALQGYMLFHVVLGIAILVQDFFFFGTGTIGLVTAGTFFLMTMVVYSILLIGSLIPRGVRAVTGGWWIVIVSGFGLFLAGADIHYLRFVSRDLPDWGQVAFYWSLAFGFFALQAGGLTLSLALIRRYYATRRVATA